MAKTAVSNVSSELLSLKSSYPRVYEESALKKFLYTFLKHFLGQKKNNWSKLCQNYFESFWAFFSSNFPFQIASLEFSLAQIMSLRNHGKSTPKPIQELLGDSRRSYRPTEDNEDSVLRYHSDRQSDISSSMLQMTRSLKAQSLEANSIIKRDIQNVEKAKASADETASSLSETSKKLADCSKDGMNWCLVILVGVVLMIFINMVIFMKIMKKNN